MILTLNQAKKLCGGYQSLVGKEIKKGWKKMGTVESIVIAPLDDANKYRFIKNYKLNGNAEDAIQFYQGALYDIMVIGRSAMSRHELITCDLEDCLSAQELSLQ